MKIEIFDERFARQEMIAKSPFHTLVIDPQSGMLLPRDVFPMGIALRKTRHDYYYDAMDYLNMGDPEKAIQLLRKALELDEHYVEAYVGLTAAYDWKENTRKKDEYTDKAYQETVRVFPEWPEEMYWGILSNRQYLRAICDKAIQQWE